MRRIIINFRVVFSLGASASAVLVDFYEGDRYGFTEVLSPTGFRELCRSGMLDLSEA